MKKLIIICAALNLTAGAQENKFDLTIENGVSRSTLSGHYSNYYLNKETAPDLNYLVGLHASFNMNNFFAIGTGIFRVNKTESVETKQSFYDASGNLIFTFNGTIKEAYSIIKCPLFIRLSSPTKCKVFAEVGAYYGYVLASYLVYKSPKEEKVNYNSNAEVGVHTKIGTAYPISKRIKLSLGVCYDIGLNSVSSNEVYNYESGTVAISDLKTKTLSATFGITYMFGLNE